jgi:hypothetical protein
MAGWVNGRITGGFIIDSPLVGMEEVGLLISLGNVCKVASPIGNICRYNVGFLWFTNYHGQ